MHCVRIGRLLIISHLASFSGFSGGFSSGIPVPHTAFRPVNVCTSVCGTPGPKKNRGRVNEESRTKAARTPPADKRRKESPRQNNGVSTQSPDYERIQNELLRHSRLTRYRCLNKSLTEDCMMPCFYGILQIGVTFGLPEAQCPE